MFRSLITCFKKYSIIIFLIYSNLLTAQVKATMESQGKSLAQGINISFLLPNETLFLENGSDAYGGEVFNLSRNENHKTSSLTLTDEKKKQVKALLKQAQKASYNIKSNQPLWAFDGISIKIEIKSGVRHIIYEDLLENAPVKNIVLKLLHIIQPDLSASEP